MKRILLLPWFLCFAFSQNEEANFLIIQGEYTQKINHSMDIVRAECTEKAINNAITGYILNDEIPEESVAAIVSCLRSKLVEISVIDESAIQTNFTITVQAFILEESITECI